jgi:hypothetical protein
MSFKTVITDDDSYKQRHNTDGVRKKAPYKFIYALLFSNPALDGGS